MPYTIPEAMSLVRIPDKNYPLYLDLNKKIVRIIKPNTIPLQVFADLWHPYLDKDYIEKCLGEKLERSNWVNRMTYYIVTKDGNEGFVPVPKYNPQALFPKTSNPDIYFIYRVNNHGIFYFK